MKKPTIPTEPRFIDKQTKVSDLPRTFVTRTTLRSILNKSGVNKLEDLEAHSCASLPNQPSASDTSVAE